MFQGEAYPEDAEDFGDAEVQVEIEEVKLEEDDDKTAEVDGYIQLEDSGWVDAVHQRTASEVEDESEIDAEYETWAQKWKRTRRGLIDDGRYILVSNQIFNETSNENFMETWPSGLAEARRVADDGLAEERAVADTGLAEERAEAEEPSEQIDAMDVGVEILWKLWNSGHAAFNFRGDRDAGWEMYMGAGICWLYKDGMWKDIGKADAAKRPYIGMEEAEHEEGDGMEDEHEDKQGERKHDSETDQEFFARMENDLPPSLRTRNRHEVQNEQGDAAALEEGAEVQDEQDDKSSWERSDEDVAADAPERDTPEADVALEEDDVSSWERSEDETAEKLPAQRKRFLSAPWRKGGPRPPSKTQKRRTCRTNAAQKEEAMRLPPWKRRCARGV
jgi:hypothetical protein